MKVTMINLGTYETWDRRQYACRFFKEERIFVVLGPLQALHRIFFRIFRDYAETEEKARKNISDTLGPGWFIEALSANELRKIYRPCFFDRFKRKRRVKVHTKPPMLKYKYRKVTADDGKPPFVGPPDSELFDRQEEYEVIMMLQKIVDDLDLKRKSDIYDLEDMIKLRLPINNRTREDVYCWLIQHFQKSSRTQTLQETIDKYIDDIFEKRN